MKREEAFLCLYVDWFSRIEISQNTEYFGGQKRDVLVSLKKTLSRGKIQKATLETTGKFLVAKMPVFALSSGEIVLETFPRFYRW